jgi:hypothetical protein
VRVRGVDQVCDTAQLPSLCRYESRKIVWSSLGFCVQSLYGSRRKLAFGSKPIENEFLMGAQRAGDSVHRLESAAQGACAPNIEKGSRPGHMPVTREGFEALL